MTNEIIIETPEGIADAAARFLSLVGDHRIIAFYAPMGAGKTTFTAAICKVLGVREDAVSSPTFSIVNQYRGADGQSIFHFDFYRIGKNEEALDIGFYDYIDSGCLCLLEWPENIPDLIPEEALKVSIIVRPDEARVIRWEQN